MSERILKISYRSTSEPLEAHLRKPSAIFEVLTKQIEECLFEEHQQPPSEIRIFWIDEDDDEVDIINQLDYDIFLVHCSDNTHLQVATVGKSQMLLPPGQYEGYNSAHNVKGCSSCGFPIVGFCYKCIECRSFYLCEKCEFNQIHPDHMMMRIPHSKDHSRARDWIAGCDRNKKLLRDEKLQRKAKEKCNTRQLKREKRFRHMNVYKSDV